MVPSGIDRERVMLQLGRLEEHLSRLKEIKDKLKDLPEDNILLSSAERLLQVSIEDCLNIGSHIIAGLGLVRADTYREVFTRLKEANILKEELGTKMEQFASFRNRLVHLYWEVSRDEVISKLQEIESLKEFAQAVLRCIEDLDAQP